MTNEELGEKILELCEKRVCKSCDGRGSHEYWHPKKKELQLRDCTYCNGECEVPSYFAQELADRLKGL